MALSCRLFFLIFQELPPDVFNAPIITASAAADGLSAEEREKAKVFDVAAGTGLCALEV